MVLFNHEEKQTGRRRVDIAASSKSDVVLGLTYHSIYDSFLAIEESGCQRQRGSRTGICEWTCQEVRRNSAF